MVIEPEKEYVLTKTTKEVINNEAKYFTTTYVKKGKDLTFSEVDIVIMETQLKEQKERNK